MRAPSGRKRSTAGHAWLPNPRSAGNRCGHRRRTRILVETVVEAVVEPNGFVETVNSTIEVKKELAPPLIWLPPLKKNLLLPKKRKEN